MRTKKAIKNAKYNIIFYLLLSALTFVVKGAFIKQLGNDINGLDSLFSSILKLINLAELGIGSAVMFALYKPVADGDFKIIKGIMDLYRKMYSIAGFVMLGLGVLFIPFLSIFIKGQFPMSSVITYYLIYILNTSFSYFFSYKLTLMYVYQENYTIYKYDGIFKILKGLLQLIVIYKLKSYKMFLFVETVCNILYYGAINTIINKAYKDILTTEGTLDVDTKQGIYTNLKALALHKVGGFVVFGTDYMIMAYFVNLSVVGTYSNYLMIITFFGSFINKIFESVMSSIGNLISSSSEEQTYNVFKRLFFVNFWIVSFVSVAIYNTMHSFIHLWVGDLYLDNIILALMVISFFITNMRPSLEKFKEAAGIYREDRFAPILEALINFVVSVILAKWFGIAGVIIGTITSSLAVVFWIRPVLVYKIVFKRSVAGYFFNYLKKVIVTIVILITSNLIMNKLPLSLSLMSFIIKCVFNTIYINVILFLLYRKTTEFTYFKDLILSKFKSITN